MQEDRDRNPQRSKSAARDKAEGRSDPKAGTRQRTKGQWKQRI